MIVNSCKIPTRQPNRVWAVGMSSAMSVADRLLRHFDKLIISFNCRTCSVTSDMFKFSGAGFACRTYSSICEGFCAFEGIFFSGRLVAM